MNRAAPLVPSLDQDLHFVLCAFGRAGLAYVETDPAEADATTIVRALLRGDVTATRHDHRGSFGARPLRRGGKSQ